MIAWIIVTAMPLQAWSKRSHEDEGVGFTFQLFAATSFLKKKIGSGGWVSDQWCFKIWKILQKLFPGAQSPRLGDLIKTLQGCFLLVWRNPDPGKKNKELMEVFFIYMYVCRTPYNYHNLDLRIRMIPSWQQPKKKKDIPFQGGGGFGSKPLPPPSKLVCGNPHTPPKKKKGKNIAPTLVCMPAPVGGAPT